MRESARKQYYYKKFFFDKIEQQLSNISLLREKIKKAKKYTTFS